ncbi:hypothetical protein NPIL_222851 [Nephila pilipes]|uniref:Uncharacterized protein n=1 Tax=Nephila pilipes TaxID=299642 RepID=A0A8X6UAT1_NEPPI|nr:hypothetical protein NPIL_222851 [Nephila pilipes]
MGRSEPPQRLNFRIFDPYFRYRATIISLRQKRYPIRLFNQPALRRPVTRPSKNLSVVRNIAGTGQGLNRSGYVDVTQQESLFRRHGASEKTHVSKEQRDPFETNKTLVETDAENLKIKSE